MNEPMKWRALCLILVSAATIVWTTRAAGQNSAALTIIAPTSGATIAPGASLPITVAVAPGYYPVGVGILAQDPLGAAPMQSVVGPTLNFVLSIPATTVPGQYSVTAVSVGASGQQLASSPISVTVERADAPTSPSASPSIAYLRFLGDTLPITVWGSFSTDPIVDVTNSMHLVATSQNPLVATFNRGVLTAVGPGQTTITLQYGQISTTLAVTVPMYLRGDLNGDGRVDQSDLNILMAALNTAANGSNDARDLNKDGVINVLDARILVTLCTLPGCATN
jgi:hypothetical protein